MLDAARELCRTGEIGAAHRRALVRVIKNGFPAGGAAVGHLVFGRARKPCFGVRTDHFGNDVAGLLERDEVAHANVALADKVGIVERRTRDGRACKADRLKHRGWGQYTRAPDGDRDIEKPRLLLLGRELVGDRPLRGVRTLAEKESVGEAVDLNDDAVDVVGERVALVSNRLDKRGDLVKGFCLRPLFQNVETERREPIERFGVALRRVMIEIEVALLKVEHKNIQPTARRDLGIELAERTCRRVPRVGKERLSRRLLNAVEAIKPFSR